jgi:tRNA A37 methylthiotransferase MiaB
MGCTGGCSFCGTKHAQDPFKSEPPGRIMEQVKQGLAQGFREIALTGEELGAYGSDLGVDLADLLAEITALPGDFKVNIRFLDPVWLIKLRAKLMPIFETGKIVAFCTPVQSGSDRILKLMNRPYTFGAIKDTINEIMRSTRVGMISTNIIVGFPSETREEVGASLRLIHEVDFGMYQVHKYQEHPNARSLLLADKVDQQEIDYRYRLLHRSAVRKHAWSLVW